MCKRVIIKVNEIICALLFDTVRHVTQPNDAWLLARRQFSGSDIGTRQVLISFIC